jgi:hypothetical protein
MAGPYAALHWLLPFVRLQLLLLEWRCHAVAVLHLM